MRVTNAMMVTSSKININGNKSSVDSLNRKLSSQKKINKPSDDPIIAVRSLRLRSSLSAIDQFYERNIPDSESWMDVTTTALKNINDIVTDAYKQTVYGATDELNQENRRTILKDLKALQEQIYSEGNADYQGRTIFTGYKTNQKLTFENEEEATLASYTITEPLTYANLETKKYYTGLFDDTTAATLTTKQATLPTEHDIKRIRLSYDKIQADDNTLNISYTNKDGDKVTASFGSDGSVGYSNATTGMSYSQPADQETAQLMDYHFDIGSKEIKTDNSTNPPTTETKTVINAVQVSGAEQSDVAFYKESELEEAAKAGVTMVAVVDDADFITDADGNEVCCPQKVQICSLKIENGSLEKTVKGTISLTQNAGDYKLDMDVQLPDEDEDSAMSKLSYQVTTTSDLISSEYGKLDLDTTKNTILLNKDSGELLMSKDVAELFERNHVDIALTYDKVGFDKGELRPENYFTCKNKTNPKHVLQYDNYDEDGNWIQEAISYNIANGQSLKINTEARDVFDCSIRRDMDELLDIVQAAVSAQEAVDSIQGKVDSGVYSGETLTKLNDWLDAAKKQRDYANQNMHDTFSRYITRFQGYLDKVDMAVTDAGSRGERLALTKTRMNSQQTVYEDLKSKNEDAELSDLVIDYFAASVAYQAALQAAGKIGQMTLLDFI